MAAEIFKDRAVIEIANDASMRPRRMAAEITPAKWGRPRRVFVLQ